MSNPPTEIIADIPDFQDGVDSKAEAKVDGEVDASAERPTVVEVNGKEEEHTAVEAVASGIVATLEAVVAEAAAAEAENGNGIDRTATPGSRTSTPPLGATASAPKKFARVDVTKKFLSKTGTPAPAAKVAGRTSSSPVPIAQPNRLLSTKLTTAPISQTSSSSSPRPPIAPPVVSNNSPWAKTSVPDGDKHSIGLQQPVPKKLGNLGGQTGLKGAQKNAWRSVPDGNQARTGMARDFPTANEIAEGQKAAQLAAQAQAAHNQALLQSINAFTHIESKEDRWDEDDDDDDVLNFGDRGAPPPPAPDVPVRKTERFGNEDFDRSWPRQPQHSDRDGRVLFNASNNRLEAPQSRPVPPPAPTRVIARPADRLDRDLPPHASLPPPNAKASDRPLPPHLAAAQSRAPPPHVQMQSHPAYQEDREERERREGRANRMDAPSTPAGMGTGRTAWNIVAQPAQPPQQAPRTEIRRPSETRPIRPSPSKTSSDLPTPPQLAAPAVQQPSLTAKAITEDDQTAEMHSAAEKARLRRLADEADRIAAQERARQKAKELEARLAAKSQSAEEKPAVRTEPVQEQSRAPPGLSGQKAAPAQAFAPQFTIAQRPKPEQASVPEVKAAETSWRRAPPAIPLAPSSQAQPQLPNGPAPPRLQTTSVPAVAPTTQQMHSAQVAAIHLPPATIEPIVRLPGQPMPSHVEELTGGDGKFDDVLARIQASMATSKASPSPSAPVIEVPKTTTQPASSTKGYFESTQIEPPRSPPPAWRTFTVRLPLPSASRPPIPLARIRAAEAPSPTPNGWCQTFNPPLESLDKSLVLIPRPLATRIQSGLNGGTTSIPVAIPKGTLDKVKASKREKKKAPEERAPIETVPIMAIESLIGAPAAESSPSWPESGAPARRKSPVKTSMAAKAERQGVFAQEAVGLSTMARRDSLPGGVRFMVSSELEGDSLLDEVNKMSLETVDEGMGDGAPKTPGSETPKTPPNMAPRNSTQPSSPTGTPWGRRHDHLKSVWDSASDHDKVEVETAMYPSLNTPLSSDPTAPTKPYEAYEAVKPATYNNEALRPNGWAGNPYTQQQNFAVQGQLWSPSYGPSMATPGYGFQQPATTDDKVQARRISAYGDGYYGQVQPVASVAQVPIQAQPQGFGAGYPYTPAQVHAYRHAQAAASAGQQNGSAYGYGASVQQAVMAGGPRRGRFAPNGEQPPNQPFVNARQTTYGNAQNSQVRSNAQQLLHQQQLAARQHALMQQQQQHQQTLSQGGGYFGGIAQQAKHEAKRSAEARQ